MIDFPRWKTQLTLFIILIAALFLGHDLYNQYQGKPSNHSIGIKLGLDLRGGSYLVLKADQKVFEKEYSKSVYEKVISIMNENKIPYFYFRNMNNTISFQLQDDKNFSIIKSEIQKYNRKLDISKNGNNIAINITEDSYINILKSVIDDSIEVVRKRVDSTGTAEVSIKKQGDNQIVVELPGVSSPEHIKNLLGTTATLTFNLVDASATFSGTQLQDGYKYIYSKDRNIRYAVSIEPAVYGKNIANASMQFQDNKPVVEFSFNSEGAKKFSDLTSKNIDKVLAIVLDNKVISAPRISAAITSGRGVIQGSFTVEEATDLAILLKAGSLPVPFSIVQEKIIGPTVGVDAIQSGIIACIFGYLLVFLYMIIFYKKLGFVANIALMINLVLMLALLSLIGATLTLPGIAGLILTLGMAADANILVYERLSKDYSPNKNLAVLISESFDRVFITIFDSNITTLLVAMFLFICGSGPIKGFAVTLMIGIITSIFCIMFVSKMLINTFIITKNNKNKKVSKKCV